MSYVPSIMLALGLVAGLVLFRWLPGRDAALVALIGGWLFLPVGAFPPDETLAVGRHALALPGLPVFNKGMALGIGCLVGALLFHWKTLRRLRPSWLDLPMVAWCLAPLASTLANDLPPRDGFLATRHLVVVWGVPYLLGRAFLSESQALARFPVLLITAAFLSLPFSLLEAVTGASIYPKLYGPHPFQATSLPPWLWFRPLLFQESSGQLGVLMGAAAVSSIWLWRTGRWPARRPTLGGLLAAVLSAVALICQSLPSALIFSTAAIAGWLAIGRKPEYVRRWSPRRGPEPETILGLMIAVALLAAVLGPLVNDRDRVTRLRVAITPTTRDPLARHFAQTRADLDAITLRPFLGTGTLDDGRAHASFAIQTAEAYGLLGLAALLAALILPVVNSARHLPPHPLSTPGGLAVATASSLLVVNLANSFFQEGWFVPLTAAAGGLAGWSLRKSKKASPPAASLLRTQWAASG